MHRPWCGDPNSSDKHVNVLRGANATTTLESPWPLICVFKLNYFFYEQTSAIYVLPMNINAPGGLLLYFYTSFVWFFFRMAERVLVRDGLHPVAPKCVFASSAWCVCAKSPVLLPLRCRRGKTGAKSSSRAPIMWLRSKRCVGEGSNLFDRYWLFRWASRPWRVLGVALLFSTP